MTKNDLAATEPTAIWFGTESAYDQFVHIVTIDITCVANGLANPVCY